MNARSSNTGFARTFLFCAAMASVPPAIAVSVCDLPPEQRQGVASYISGGIGDDEAKAMQDLAHKYPLQVQFVQRETNGHGAFLAGVDVSIHDRDGKQVLRTMTEGPFLLARLPPGRYVITADYENERRERKLNVPARGSERVVLGW